MDFYTSGQNLYDQLSLHEYVWSNMVIKLIFRLFIHSWDEMAKYDLKAMFDYILTYTEHTDLYYVGHSQGTLIGFAGFSSSFELASKVRTFFAMGPVTTVGSIKSPIRYLAPFSHEIEV